MACSFLFIFNLSDACWNKWIVEWDCWCREKNIECDTQIISLRSKAINNHLPFQCIDIGPFFLSLKNYTQIKQNDKLKWIKFIKRLFGCLPGCWGQIRKTFSDLTVIAEKLSTFIKNWEDILLKWADNLSETSIFHSRKKNTNKILVKIDDALDETSLSAVYWFLSKTSLNAELTLYLNHLSMASALKWNFIFSHQQLDIRLK